MKNPIYPKETPQLYDTLRYQLLDNKTLVSEIEAQVVSKIIHYMDGEPIEIHISFNGGAPKIIYQYATKKWISDTLTKLNVKFLSRW